MTELSASTRIALTNAGLRADEIVAFAALCIREDLDGGVDVTSESTIPHDDMSIAKFVVRGTGVLAGLPVLAATLETNLPKGSIIEIHAVDGQRVSKGDVVATVSAQTIPLLTVERTALNI